MPESLELYKTLKLNSDLRGLAWQPYFDELAAARREDPLWIHDPVAWRESYVNPLDYELLSVLKQLTGLEEGDTLDQLVYQFHRDIPDEVREAIVEIGEIRERLEQERGVIPAPLELPSEVFISSDSERKPQMSSNKQAGPAQDLSKVVVYNIPWQLLRIQLLSRYSEKGGFDNVDGVRDNLQKLKSYLGSKRDINKVWQVLNLLNATRMGFAGQHDIGSAKDKLLVKYRDEISGTYQALKETQEFKPDTDAEIRADVRKASPELLEKVYRDLRSRYREQPAGVGPAKERLKHFLSLIEKEKPSFKESRVTQEIIKSLKDLSHDLTTS